MIQRIQTLFLLLALICLALFLWMPLMVLEAPGYTEAVQGWDVRHFQFGYIFYINLILTGTAFGLSLIAIFLFKHRDYQIIFSWFSLVFVTAAQAFVYYKFQTKVFMGDVVLTYWNLLSIASVALLLAAVFFIRKDEHLLQSLDRLRD
ncbi:MAG: DUF4293 family protein [Bacteroidetes bacterium]|nr:DUF4293 family protein [Bacteroidota bacterium]MBK8659283.1 DUF4293 family protein [Bacteroidota bacterium]